MEEGTGKIDEGMGQAREEIFSEAVRAGKRTYFFDVKATRSNDYYLTITESKKRFNRDGKSFYEKHKVFLYKEDFEKFTDGLASVIDFIKKNQPELLEHPYQEESEETLTEEFTSVEFEDLGSKNS